MAIVFTCVHTALASVLFICAVHTSVIHQRACRSSCLQMLHSIMLAICPLLKRPHLSGVFFLTGTAVFSGSCYAAVFTKDRANGRFAPIGGTALIVGWLTLVL